MSCQKKEKKEFFYFDHAATSSVDQEIKKLIISHLKRDINGNPSSRHEIGLSSRRDILNAKKQISGLLGIAQGYFHEENVIFTSGATESNNLFIQGYCMKNKGKGKHIVIGPTEHDCVREAFKYLVEGEGFECTEIKLTKEGSLDLKHLNSILRPNTILVSQMYVNNQFGTVYDLENVCKIVASKSPNACVHIDSVQAMGKVILNISRLSCFTPVAMTFSGHKIHSPKGIGLLVYDSQKRNPVIDIKPLVYGGGQEKGSRSGTENFIGIISIQKAIELACSNLIKNIKKYEMLYKHFCKIVGEINKTLEKKLVYVVKEQKTTHAILSVVIPDVLAEVVFNHMSQKKVFCSVGSACQARDKKLSPTIVKRLGKKIAKNVLRFSFSKDNTIEEIEKGVKTLFEVVKKLYVDTVGGVGVNRDNIFQAEIDNDVEMKDSGEKKKEKWKRKKVRVSDKAGNFSRILCRVGELALKKRNRKYFMIQLRKNMANACKEICKCYVDKKDRRMYVRTVDEKDKIFIPQIAKRLQKVFGLVNVSICFKVENNFETILNSVLTVCKKKLEETTGIITFKIETKRGHKKFPLTSVEVSQRIGGKVKALDPTRYVVKLKKPMFEVGLDIRSEGTYIYTDKIQCEGGLPVGTTGKGLCLLSGGIDSPVASYLMMKRGMTVNFISFYSFPYTSQKLIDKIKKIVEKLSQYQGTSAKIFFVPFTKTQEAIRDMAPEPYRTILYRRSMNKIAIKAKNKINAKCLITGESLGQVASQTINNIISIREPVGNTPIFRPLIGADKSDIIEIAQKIGTFELSNIPEPDTCTLFQ